MLLCIVSCLAIESWLPFFNCAMAVSATIYLQFYVEKLCLSKAICIVTYMMCDVLSKECL